MSKESVVNLKNKKTGVTVSVRESKAAKMGRDWEPAKAPAKPKSDKK